MDPEDSAKEQLARDLFSGRISRREFMKRAALLGLGASTVGQLLVACGTSATPTPTKAAGQAVATGVTAGKMRDQITIAIGGLPPGWDPDQDSGVNTDDVEIAINDQLVRWKITPYAKEANGYNADASAKDFEQQLEPRLAEKWKSEGNTHTFTLRQGVMSHAGNELTADDVKWTIDRAFALKGNGAFMNAVSGLASPDDCKVVDKYTVSFTIALPKSIFFMTLAIMYRSIFDSKEMKKHATADDPYAAKWGRQGDAGFGQYKISLFEPGKQLVLEGHDKHYLGAPPIKKIILQEVPNSANRLALLSKGTVDVARELVPKEYASLQGQSGLRVWNFPGVLGASYQFCPAYPPMDKVEVRRALAYACPYDTIINEVFKGFGRKQGSPVPDTYPGYKDYNTFKTDLEKAKSLLASAGLSSGFNTEIAYNSEHPLHENLAVLYQTNLEKIGVKATLKGKTALDYYAMLLGGPVKEKKSPIMVYMEGPYVPDPYYVMFLFFDSKAPLNTAMTNIPAADKAIEPMATAEFDKRLELSQEAQRILVEDAAWVFAAHPGLQIATRDYVTGVAAYLGFFDYSKLKATA